jgi:hypothetical protein
MQYGTEIRREARMDEKQLKLPDDKVEIWLGGCVG